MTHREDGGLFGLMERGGHQGKSLPTSPLVFCLSSWCKFLLRSSAGGQLVSSQCKKQNIQHMHPAIHVAVSLHQLLKEKSVLRRDEMGLRFGLGR